MWPLGSSPPKTRVFWGWGIYTGSISSHLNVLLGDEPGPVRQQLVDLIEVAEFLGSTVQPLQPCWVAPHLQELPHVQAHQVGALVSGRCLRGKPGSQLLAGAWGPPKPCYEPLEKPRQGATPCIARRGFSLGMRVQTGVSSPPHPPSMPAPRRRGLLGYPGWASQDQPQRGFQASGTTDQRGTHVGGCIGGVPNTFLPPGKIPAEVLGPQVPPGDPPSPRGPPILTMMAM